MSIYNNGEEKTMNKDANIIFRVNSDLKDDFSAIAKERGVSLSELLTACMRDITFRGKVPLYVNKYLPPIYEKENKLSIAKIKKLLDEVIEKQEKKKLISKAYLFGSYARGEETDESDIDIRIEADKGLGLIDIGNMRLDMVEATGKDVDLLVVHPENMDPVFYQNIRKDEICIYER